MAIEHARPLQVIDVGPLGEHLEDRVSHSLIKTPQMQVIRMVLKAGRHVPEHHVTEEITLQCLEGEAQIEVPGEAIHLMARQLVLLPAGQPHAVRALTDTSLLVTILQPAEGGHR